MIVFWGSTETEKVAVSQDEKRLQYGTSELEIRQWSQLWYEEGKLGQEFSRGKDDRKDGGERNDLDVRWV